MTSKNQNAHDFPFPISERWCHILDSYFIKSALLLMLGGLGSIIWLVLLPADEARILLLGLSRNRLLMAAFILLASLLLLAAAFKWKTLDKRFFSFLLSGKKLAVWTIVGLACLFVTGVLLLLSPYYRFWQFYYFSALLPCIAWVTLGLFLVLLPIAILKWQIAAQENKDLWKEHIHIKKPLATTMVVLIAMAAVMLVFRLGFKADISYWNENGIPLLLTQILLSILISQLALVGIHRIKSLPSRIIKSGHVLDAVIFLAIWAGGALLLNATPVVQTHFSPGPYPPNYTFYPLSDALIYDRYAQQVLVGEGYAGGKHIGKPLLAAMLVLFHTLAGGDYANFYIVQASFLAVIPAFLYLIGKRLHGRAAGILGGLFVLFLERNTYQGILYLSSSHSKLILSEVPAVLFMVAATYFLVSGFGQKDTVNLTALGISVGVMGLSTMVRENTLILVPLPFLFVLVYKGWNWRKKINAVLLMSLFLLAAITPWALRTYQVKGTPFYFAPKIQNVIIENRLLPLLEEEESTSFLPTNPCANGKDAMMQIPGGMMSSRENILQGTIDAINPLCSANQQSSIFELLGLGEAIVQHFFHNLATSFAILPVSLQLEDLTHAAQDRLNLFPGMDAAGRLRFGTVIAILLNLFLLAVGISAAWQKRGLVGLMPLVFYLVYTLSLAIARTSGGRYIVAINWALLLYYAIGIAHCILWLASRLGFAYAAAELMPALTTGDAQEAHTEVKNPIFHAAAAFLVVFAIGVLIPLTEKIFPRKYPDETDPLGVQRLYEENLIPAETYEAYQQLISAEELSIIHGRLLYPRFYLAGEEVSRKSGYGFRKMDFPRLHFMLQGSSFSHVILPLGESPPPIPDSADAYAVGCEGKVFFAKLVLIYDQQTGQYKPLWWDDNQPDPCLDVQQDKE